jgi:hypothetical protein
MFAAATLVSTVSARPTVATFPAPALDRWNYTFGSSGGAETEATVFSILGSGYENMFDIRDGQFLVGYDTAPTVPSALPLNHYRLISASLTVRTSRDKVFRYDPSFDPVGTGYAPTDPQYVADTDPDHPVELYAVGYRSGYTVASYAENSPFSLGNPAQKQVRIVYAAQYSGPNATGSLIDVSNNVMDVPGLPRFEVRPLALGTCAATPGAQVDLNTDMTFDVDLSNPDAQRYFRESFAGGRLNLMISSMTVTSLQSSTTPAFWTKEAPAVLGAAAPRLELRVCVGAPADWNCSGAVTVQDIFDFLADYFTNHGDMNADGLTSVQDIFDFLAAYFSA